MTKLPATKPGRRRLKITIDKDGKTIKSKDDLSPAEIQKLCARVTDTSNLRDAVLENLFQFVALTEETLFEIVSESVEFSPQIDSFSRSLRRYAHDRLIDYLPYDVIKKSLRAGLPKSSQGRRLLGFRLDAVGLEFATKIKGWNHGAATKDVSEEFLTHDLLCAEAMFHMRKLWRNHPTSPGLVDVVGPRSLVIWDDVKQRSQLEPDGLFKKNTLSGEFQRAFLVEYQNVRALNQVKTKIARYEELAQDPSNHLVWGAWELAEMPIILILYRQPSTLTHYQQELHRLPKVFTTYVSASLEDIWAGRLTLETIRQPGE